MHLTNHLESIWIGSGGVIVLDYMNRVSLVGMVDYNAILGLVATGIGLLGMKAVEIWKGFNLAKTSVDQKQFQEQIRGYEAQIKTQKQGYEDLLKIKDDIIQHLRGQLSSLNVDDSK